MGSFTMDTDLVCPGLQIADLAAWSIRSDLQGFPSPVLNAIRDGIGGAFGRPWNASGLAQRVVNVEEQLRKKWPSLQYANIAGPS